MSLSNNLKLLGTICISLSIALLLPLSSRSYGQSVSDDHNTLQFVHDFVRVAYGETFSAEFLQLCVKQKMNEAYQENLEINFGIRRFDPDKTFDAVLDSKTGKPIDVPQNAIFLEGAFQFDSNQKFESMSTNLLESNKYLSVRKLVESHREWSEADANRALKDAGARYSGQEGQALRQSIHLERFGQLIGRLKVTSAEFDAFANDEHIANFALLFWIVRAEAQMPDGTQKTYSFIFEPFDANLVMVKHIASQTH
jgi:hypothetical protein